MSEKDIAREIKRLEKLMLEHARNLEFEKAARVRDQLHMLKEQALARPAATTWCRFPQLPDGWPCRIKSFAC